MKGVKTSRENGKNKGKPTRFFGMIWIVGFKSIIELS
jgi:hypothetical protein